jgi:hypothetical protein
VRFLVDSFAVYAEGHWAQLLEVPYSVIEDVEIGGPGLVRTGGRFVGGGFGAVGALEGMAIAGVLNALTARASITTILRVQATNCELFLLHTQSTPEALRMELSQALGAVRAAKPSQRALAATSMVAELAKLGEMLQECLITRDEFEVLKARLLSS